MKLLILIPFITGCISSLVERCSEWEHVRTNYNATLGTVLKIDTHECIQFERRK